MISTFKWRPQISTGITGHRRENFMKRFLNICRAIKALAAKYPDWGFCIPHAPQSQRPQTNTNNIYELSPKGGGRGGAIFFIEPLDYLSCFSDGQVLPSAD